MTFKWQHSTTFLESINFLQRRVSCARGFNLSEHNSCLFTIFIYLYSRLVAATCCLTRAVAQSRRRRCSASVVHPRGTTPSRTRASQWRNSMHAVSSSRSGTTTDSPATSSSAVCDSTSAQVSSSLEPLRPDHVHN